MNCGQPVGVSSQVDADRLSQLTAATPAPLAAKMRASAYLAGEQRFVTALFLDVVDSTGLIGQLGKADWAKLIDEAFDHLYPVIYRYEGTITHLQQDTMLAFFGAPVAHEDDPTRALFAALDLVEAAQEFGRQVEARLNVPFAVRIGMSTGPVMVTAVGQDLKVEYRPIGNLINLASRIQTLVPANRIAISEETFHFLAPFIDATAHCMINLEGQFDPVCVYALNRIVAEPDQLRGVHGLESPMVSRAAELAALVQLTETVRAGLGRAVLILGEPGIGKTRLIDEWRSAFCQSEETSEISWFHARSQSYARTSAYHLLTVLIFDLLGLPSSASEAEISAALTHKVEALIDDPAEVVPYLAHLLNLPLEGEYLEQVRYLDPEALQSRFLAALNRLVLTMAEHKPVILILEDLHWADPSSLDLIIRSLPLATSAPILVCVVMRPDRDSPGWELVSAARDTLGDSLTEILLHPLSEIESNQLLSNLLSNPALPVITRSLILGNSEGNPLFVEEMIRMLISQGVLVPHDGAWQVEQEISSLEVPATLQGLLIARIDRLPSEVRDTLRVASVVGRNFQLNLLEKVMGHGSLLSHMSTLETAGLIRVTQVTPGLAYSFRHALVHEAIYASLLLEDRRQLHLAVGEALEELFAEQSRELAPRLAAHFHAAGDVPRAVKYYLLAGEAALSAFANQEAENHLRSALDLCESDGMRGELLSRLGEALFNQGRYFAAIDTWRQAVGIAQRLGNRDAEARLYARSARAAWHAGDTPGGLAICEEGLHRLDPALETAGAAALLHETARARYFNGQLETVKEMGEKALLLAERAGDVNVQADTLATLGLLTTFTHEESLAALKRAVELAESHNLLATAARAHINLGTTLIRIRGDLRQARKHYLRAAEIHHTRGAVSDELFARVSIADVTFTLGELTSVEEVLNSLEKLVKSAPDPELSSIWLKIFEAQLMGSRGEWNRAVPLLRDYRQQALARQDLSDLGDITRSLGWILMEMYLWNENDQTDEALELLLEALQHYERSMKPKVSLHCLAVMLHTVRGEIDQAAAQIESARQLAGENPIPLEAVWLLWARAYIEAHHAHWSNVYQAYQEAVGLVIPIGLRWHWARMLKDWAEALIRRGETEDIQQAQNLLNQSRELFEQLGAPEYAHRVEQRLHAIATDTLAQAVAHQQVNRELAMAGRIQESFLPEAPSLSSGWELSVTLKPARQTSGDFYDFIPLPGSRLGILIGDVADKGVGAALFMTLSRTLIRTYAGDISDRPEEVFAAANRRMLEDSRVGLFVTAFYGVLELDTGLINYINAGHNPPFLLRADHPEAIASLTRTGIPLGVFADATWGPVQLQLNPGDALVLYTDGLTEAQNDADEFYGDERLVAALQKYGQDLQLTADGLKDALLDDISAFIGARPRLDDLALIVLKRAGAADGA
jgi:serine phosphatase RsbU (regulator of sigma subunit)/class 3 adenylate cyclase/tetratricopeptide (TPR) repeat protein